jgi:hypothetical protein
MTSCGTKSVLEFKEFAEIIMQNTKLKEMIITQTGEFSLYILYFIGVGQCKIYHMTEAYTTFDLTKALYVKQVH